MTKNEMLLWHQQYLACCAELNQWDTVVEYAKVTDNCPLQIDSMVQLHDWQNLKAVSCGLNLLLPAWFPGMVTLFNRAGVVVPFQTTICYGNKPASTI